MPRPAVPAARVSACDAKGRREVAPALAASMFERAVGLESKGDAGQTRARCSLVRGGRKKALKSLGGVATVRLPPVRYSSGQRGQTVNLLGSALHWFESSSHHHFTPVAAVGSAGVLVGGREEGGLWAGGRVPPPEDSDVRGRNAGAGTRLPPAYIAGRIAGAGLLLGPGVSSLEGSYASIVAHSEFGPVGRSGLGLRVRVYRGYR